MAITIKRDATTFHKSNPRPTDVPVGSYGARIMAAQNAAQVQNLVGPTGFKNHIINGDFRIWQRGTQGSSNTTSGIDSADRWWINKSSGTGYSERYVFTRGDSVIPGNPSYAIKVVCNTGNNNFGLLQKVEDVRAFMGQYVTLSFWAKGRNPGGGHFKSSWIRSYTSAGNNGEWTVADNIVLNEEWQFFSFTTKVPNVSGGQTINDSESYLWVDILRQPGDDNSTTNWDYKLANVQLEFGTQATAFEYRPLAVEYPLCQRYFLCYPDKQTGGGNHTLGNVWAPSTNEICWNPTFPVPMRAEPNFTFSGDWTHIVFRHTNNASQTFSGSINVNQTETTTMNAGVWLSGMSHGQATNGVGELRTLGGNTAHFHLDAEL